MEDSEQEAVEDGSVEEAAVEAVLHPEADGSAEVPPTKLQHHLPILNNNGDLLHPCQGQALPVHYQDQTRLTMARVEQTLVVVVLSIQEATPLVPIPMAPNSTLAGVLLGVQ